VSDIGRINKHLIQAVDMQLERSNGPVLRVSVQAVTELDLSHLVVHRAVPRTSGGLVRPLQRVAYFGSQNGALVKSWDMIAG